MSADDELTTADASPRWCSASSLLIEPLDSLTAVFHRASGITHLLAEPAPEIVAALAGGPLTESELLDRLRRDFELADPDALAARLTELAIAGLVESSPRR